MYRAFILRYPIKQGFLNSYIWGPKTQFKFSKTNPCVALGVWGQKGTLTLIAW